MATKHYKVAADFDNLVGHYKKGEVYTEAKLGDTAEHLLFAGLVVETDAPVDAPKEAPKEGEK